MYPLLALLADQLSWELCLIFFSKLVQIVRSRNIRGHLSRSTKLPYTTMCASDATVSFSLPAVAAGVDTTLLVCVPFFGIVGLAWRASISYTRQVE
jgi:hypothetical protein